ncbi:hypothetical protein ABID23_000573 [Bartonella silvatica]|uniref:Uncharacterized protein n=1 Tax=Bartonella silvatica TaxID=357760 RepID=A0ABV2HG15_9HYPH
MGNLITVARFLNLEIILRKKQEEKDHFSNNLPIITKHYSELL